MTFEKVKEIIIDTISCEKEAVVLEAKLMDDLGIDSLDVVELNMALEEAFEITIADEDLATFATVKDIVDFIDKNNA